MAGVKSLESRPCSMCRRMTLHTVTKSKNGMGAGLNIPANGGDFGERCALRCALPPGTFD
jgi:hypothetical protein